MKTQSNLPDPTPAPDADGTAHPDAFGLVPHSDGEAASRDLLRRGRTAFIKYPRLQRLWDSLDECLDEAQLSGAPYCMSLEGPSGAGKSTTLRKFAASFPRTETPTGTRIPVLHVQLPCPATCKGMDAAILEELGDPAAHRGTLDAMVARIVLYLRRCEVRLLVLDDVHNMLISETDRKREIVSGHLKDLIKRSGVTVLAVSVPDRIEELLRGNKELSRLFAIRETLYPFTWDAANPESIREFAAFVQCAEQAVGMPVETALPRMDLLYRLYNATGGVVSYIMALLRGAQRIALREGRATITLDDLSTAYERNLSAQVRVPNPFTEAPQRAGGRAAGTKSGGQLSVAQRGEQQA